MPLRLRVIPPASARSAGSPITEHSIDFEDGVAQIRIGRRADLEMSLPYSALSGVHARLLKSTDPKPDHWVLEDLGSTNGTYVEGERVKPGIKRPLTAGAKIKLAEVIVIFDGDVQRAAPVALSGRGTEPTRILPPEAESKKIRTKTGPIEQPRITEPVVVAPKVSDAKVAEAKATLEAKVAEAKAAFEAKVAEAKAAEAKAAKEARLAEAKAALEAKVADAKDAEPKSADPKAPKKAPDPTETYVRPQSRSDLFSPSPIAAPVPYLKIVSGGSGGETFRLEQREHEYLFGRTQRCEFRVKTNEVSREHASFTHRADGVYVNDLGSVNGVLVNNTKVREFRLYDGDLIQLGHMKLRLFDPTETSPRRPERGRIPPPSESRAHPPPEPPSYAHTFAPPRSESTSAGQAGQVDFHPAIAGALAAEGYAVRPRRQSVRVRFTETWVSSSRFRYAIVIVCAAVLAVVAVIGGFALAG